MVPVKTDSEEPTRLSPEDFSGFLSPYLTGGWREDDVEIKWVDLDRTSITGCLRVTRHFVPSDGEFHFTLPLAFLFVAQLAIIHACWEHRLPKKAGEVYLRDIQVRCRRKVASTDNILLTLEQTNKKYRGSSVLIEGDIDLDGGAFVGRAKYVFPLPVDMAPITSLSL